MARIHDREHLTLCIAACAGFSGLIGLYGSGVRAPGHTAAVSTNNAFSNCIRWHRWEEGPGSKCRAGRVHAVFLYAVVPRAAKVRPRFFHLREVVMASNFRLKALVVALSLAA